RQQHSNRRRYYQCDYKDGKDRTLELVSERARRTPVSRSQWPANSSFDRTPRIALHSHHWDVVGKLVSGSELRQAASATRTIRQMVFDAFYCRERQFSMNITDQLSSSDVNSQTNHIDHPMSDYCRSLPPRTLGMRTLESHPGRVAAAHG